ncbi:MAG: type II secretion system F family protein [Candidatus Paceibacterota bacterium]
MTQYVYRAIDKVGQDVSGNREAADEYDLARILKQEGLVMVSSEIATKKRGGLNVEIKIPTFGGIGFVDKLMFVRNLQIMVAAGISLPQALEIIAAQTENTQLQKIIYSVKDEIIKGKSFSETARKYPKVFSDFFCGMVSIGEKTGGLDRVLKDLAYQMEKEYRITSKIKGAMTYPSVIVSVMLIMGIGLMIFVVPNLLKMFVDMGVELKDLPVTTQALVAIGDYFKQPINVAVFLGVIALIIFAITSFARTKPGKRFFDNLSIKLPVIGTLVRKSNIASIIGNFSVLMQSGVPVVQSLQILSSATTNYYYAKSLGEAIEKIQKGKKLSEALQPYKNLYTLSVVQMIGIGEETGMTSDILRKLSEFYEEEVSRAADSLTTIIEPLLMIVVAIAVGFFASALFSPIYSTLGNL